jgi:RNA-directed DNA polymerase
VHHILVDYLEGIFEPKFIFDSYACRKKKGIHLGVKRLQGYLRKVTLNGSRGAFYLQLDIANFFMSIDKDILYALIADKVGDEGVLWLARTLIYHDCTKDYVLKGDMDYLKKRAPQKSLFYTKGRKGLPIGNLTSQFFANVYLNELDQFVKHRLKCRYYLRYCDDFVLLSDSREELLKWKDEIKTFIAERLRLSLNEKRQSLLPVKNGINFLGYIVRKDYVLVRRRVVNNLREKLSCFEKELVTNDSPPYVRVVYNYDLLEKLRATLASYFGHFRWANTFRLKKSLLKRYSFLKWFFKIKGWNIIPKYKIPSQIPTLKLQYRYFKTKFAGDVIFLKKGKYYEFFEDDKDIALKLGLKQMNRHSDRNTKYGFPIWLEKSFSARIRRMGRSLTVITEGGRYLTGIKERFPKYRLVT